MRRISAEGTTDEVKICKAQPGVERLDNVHRAQLFNYLRISGMRVGLRMDFASPKLEYERIVI